MSLKSKVNTGITIIARHGINGVIKTITDKIYYKFYWYQSLQRKIFKGEHRLATNLPRIYQIEISAKCNLKCEMCSLNKQSKSGYMTCDEFKGIIDKIPKLKSVAINGIGEPLLCPDFIPIINLLEKRKINFSFYTNAMLLNEKMQEILCNKKYFSNIGVSCDSSKKEIYELIRKGANFEIFVKNVKSFLRKIESKKLNIVANMNCVLTKRNIAHADEIIVFASDLGFKQISFTEMINNNPQCDDISVTNGIKSSMKAVDLIALGKEKEISVNFTFKNKSKDIICFAPWEVLYIDYTGQIFPCCTIIDRELVPNLGNLKMKTLQDIWNSFEYQKLRDDFIRAESSFCNKCYFYHG